MFPTDNGQTLAEPTRTDIEKELVGLFYHGDKTGLINIITIVLTDIYKIHHPLRNALAIGIHNRLLWIHLQTYDCCPSASRRTLLDRAVAGFTDFQMVVALPTMKGSGNSPQ